VPAVAISIPRRCRATTTNLRMGPVPTPYPPPNSSGMNTYENQGEGGAPSRTFSGSGSLFLAPSDLGEGCTRGNSSSYFSIASALLPRTTWVGGAIVNIRGVYPGRFCGTPGVEVASNLRRRSLRIPICFFRTNRELPTPNSRRAVFSLPPYFLTSLPSPPPPSAPLTAPLALCYPYNAAKIAQFRVVTSRMAPDTKHLEVTLETQVESVNLAEEMCLRLAEAAGFGEDECYRIGMSVREGVINAFHYGNKEKPEKKIHLAVDLTPEKMIIHVTDEGTGFVLKDVPDPLAEENLLSTSGRGIFLMRAFMDEFDVVKAQTGGAEIVMSKRLPNQDSPQANGSHGSAPHREA